MAPSRSNRNDTSFQSEPPGAIGIAFANSNEGAQPGRVPERRTKQAPNFLTCQFDDLISVLPLMDLGADDR